MYYREPETYGFTVGSYDVVFDLHQYDHNTFKIWMENTSEISGFQFKVLDEPDQIEFSDVSFDSLAKVFSHDPGTSQSGGFLGFTTRGSLVKEYEEVAYSLLPGEIGGPIKTPFGYHIIRLIDKQGEKISTQHILRIVDFSSEDKNLSIGSLENIFVC